MTRELILVRLGFKDYHDYLCSDLWASIRHRVIAKKGKCCWICANPYEEVHHFQYDEETMRGKRLDHLYPLCVICHKLVEFDEHERKRTLHEAQNEFIQLARLRVQPNRQAAIVKKAMGLTTNRKATRHEKRKNREEKKRELMTMNKEAFVRLQLKEGNQKSKRAAQIALEWLAELEQLKDRLEAVQLP